ncbi:MAG: hypothetical protein PUB39_05600 [Eubacteriales bacterium]|nr:hypothetical protein [Eubacteriales bacterium]
MKSKTVKDSNGSKAVQTTIKNSSKYAVNVIGEVKFYDGAGKLVSVKPFYSNYLSKKQTQTYKYTADYPYSQNFAKYVVIYKSYYKK